MPTLLPPLAAMAGGGEFLILLAILVSSSIPIISIVGYYIVRHRREKLWHETTRIALEKGQPIPAQPNKETAGPGGSPFDAVFDPPPQGVSPERWAYERRERKREKDLKSGLVTLGLGTALYMANHDMALPGFVLIGIGAALVLSYLLTRNNDGHRGPPPA